MPKQWLSPWLGRVALAVLGSCVVVAAHAEPTQLAVQGRLTSAVGGVVADGAYGLAISLYDQPAGSSALWQEKFLAVPVQGGVFALTLGADLVKLDNSLFGSGKGLWVGIQVGGDPELVRQPLLRVPYAVHAQQATSALALQCSGCVGEAELAKGAVTADKIAAGAVNAGHVAFNWAGGDGPGGAANFALAANTAKLADLAKSADAAAYADDAGSASKAKLAADLQCTGCVGAADLDPAVLAPYAKSADLGVLATKDELKAYAKSADLGALAKLDQDNAFAAKNSFAGLSTSGAIDFAKNEAKLMRLHNAATAPTVCDASAVGLIYYNTAEQALYVCNGSEFALFAVASALGSDGNAALSCKQIKDAQPSAQSGLYWLDADGKAGPLVKLQAFCDMATDGGGWTEVLRCLPSDGCTVGGAFLYVSDWLASDKGAVSLSGSYLRGASLKPTVQAGKDFLVSIENTATKQAGHLKYPLDASTIHFFNAPTRYESAPLAWTAFDANGAKTSYTSRICWQPSGAIYPVRSMQAVAEMILLGQTAQAPWATANDQCDYGPWEAQILVRGSSGGVSGNFGATGGNLWSGQPFAHRVLVR